MAGKFFNGKKDFTRVVVLIFVFGVIILFLAEIVFIPLSSSRDTSPTSANPVEFAKKFEKSWIFDNLTDQEKSYLMGNSRTIATYNYTDSPQFFEFETIVNEFGGQIVLERAKSDKRVLALQSMRGEETVENLTNQNIFAALCMVLEKPPPDCSSIEQ
jgi:hypothetical protein